MLFRLESSVKDRTVDDFHQFIFKPRRAATEYTHITTIFLRCFGTTILDKNYARIQFRHPLDEDRVESKK